MLHVIAFVVIGVVIGAFFVRGASGGPAIIRVVAGLVGSLLGGFLALAALGTSTTTGKYGSLLVAIVVAAILAAVAQRVTGGSAQRR